jgi:transposase
MFRQCLEVDTIARNIDFFRTPEEGELLFDQFFKDVIFLLIVAATFTGWPKNIGSRS